MKKLWKIKLAVLSFLALGALSLPLATLANTQALDGSLIIDDEQAIEGNIIRFGSVINISADVRGDVIVAGNNINISGRVSGDVMAIGNSIRISGPVEGSVRALGSSVEITNEVSKNAWAAGNIIFIGPEAKIGWDVLVAGASVDIRGAVGGNVKVEGSSVILAGQVGKDVKLNVDESGSIVLLPTAVVAGTLNYSAFEEKVFSAHQDSKIEGGVNYSVIEKKQHQDWQAMMAGGFLFFKVVSLFGMLVVGIVLVSLAPKVLVQVHDSMLKSPAAMIGKGFIYVFIVPIVAFLILLTLIGWPLSVIIMVVYFLSLYLANIFAGFTIGLWLFNKISKESYKGALVWPLIAGILVLFVLTVIPVVGFVAKILLMLWALGAVYSFKQEMLKDFR
jgi:cytoskeletal protein CcmA (bactofilin family)